jgi:hypothetical protein
MQITVIRSGGQTGRPFKLGPIDTSQLDDEQCKEIESKVDDSGFFDLRPKLDDTNAFDSYKYEITITDDARTNAVSFDEASEEAKERGLLELVKLLEDAGGEWEPEALGDDGGTTTDAGRKLECEDWSAHHHGDDLHVSGKCEAPVARVRARLELGDEGIQDEPDLLVLELKLEWPEASNEVVTPIEIDQVFRDQPGIERIRIQGGADAEIDVD